MENLPWISKSKSFFYYCILLVTKKSYKLPQCVRTLNCVEKWFFSWLNLRWIWSFPFVMISNNLPFFLLFYWTLNIKLGKFDENSRNHRYTRLHRIFKVKFAELSSKNINTRQSEKYSKRKLNYGTKVGRRDQMRSQFRRKVIWPGIIVRFDGITPNKSSETRQQRKTLGETLLEAHIGNATRRTGRNFN